MKITDIKPIPTQPTEYSRRSNRTWTFVQIDTDEGITGYGEATNYPGGGSLVVASTINQVREALIGEDPFDIDRLWHKIYRRYTYLGSRGLVTAVISGIDIALWDIKGKALGRPVYEILGGKFRDNITMYANGWFTGCETPEDFADAAAATVAQGYTALKFDPFTHEMAPFHTGYVSGTISADGEQLGMEKVAAVREAVGPQIEVLIDAHGHYNVPTAIRIGNRLAEHNVTWYEEPVPPEGYEALAQVRQNVAAPICVGERLFTRYDFLPIFENRLADYIMPDVVWTGGISELRKIATMAEAYYIPVSPHNAMGSVQIIAGAHTMMTVPNFYRLEFSIAALEGYNAVLDKPLDIRDGNLHLPTGPGLGYDLDTEFMAAHPDPAWSG
ncbi:MAG: mandelate racemase/muconate lactonizing enzyme family protein [SAR202 cluster bacterium]|jgi:galactonate dehydratase|nr:mandelate racemase/muconate lactonizing enzyme family protein [SAR202 cluster bacterium]MDP6713786.1 mandelate racemase/muconate lactonizing enzyme family protein [SAR202 cluster bacterium]